MATAKKSTKKPTKQAPPPAVAFDTIARDFHPEAPPAERLAAAQRTGNTDLVAAVRLELGR